MKDMKLRLKAGQGDCVKEIRKNLELFELGSIFEDLVTISNVYAIYYVPEEAHGYAYIKLFFETEPGKEGEVGELTDIVVLGYMHMLKEDAEGEGLFHLIASSDGLAKFKLYTDIATLDLQEELKKLMGIIAGKDAEEILAHVFCTIIEKMVDVYKNAR